MNKIIKLIFTLALLLIPMVSLAGYNYDYRTGNSYTTYKDSLGNTQVNGHNYQTGSNWNTTIDNQGNMKGYDSKSNYWQYNNGTGTYYNYGTGEMCIGKGYARVCNK